MADPSDLAYNPTSEPPGPRPQSPDPKAPENQAKAREAAAGAIPPTNQLRRDLSTDRDDNGRKDETGRPLNQTKPSTEPAKSSAPRASLGDFVLWTRTEASDHNGVLSTSFLEAPAVVTAVGTIWRQPLALDPLGRRVGFRTVEGGGRLPPEEIPVVSLTVFRAGYEEYYDQVEAYSDSIGRTSGVHAWREAGTPTPKVDWPEPKAA